MIIKDKILSGAASRAFVKQKLTGFKNLSGLNQHQIK
jgi:hypothetical protein